MSDPLDARAAQLRWGVYFLLIALAAGSAVGRILAVNSVDVVGLEKYLDNQYMEGKRELRDVRQQRPFLSANDRSRWCTIRALVEYDTYEIDAIVSQPLWDTIDKVRHLNRDGKPRLYSSKPTLLPTLLAGEYWVIHHLTGANLGEHPYEIGRFMLITFNVIPLVVMLLLLASLVERFGTTDWGRVFVMACATFGTFLTTFAVVLNNHLPAAVSATVAVYAVVRIWMDGERRLRFFAIAGLFAAFTAANELPAFSFFAALTVGLLYKAPRQALVAYVPAALLVAAGFFGTNRIAHDDWRPPYMHRSETDPLDNWYDYTYVDHRGREVTSYWMTEKVGVDRGEPSRAIYALHAIIGHHGVFSLTPIWLLSLVGVGLAVRGDNRTLSQLSLVIAALSIVCLAFYIARPEIDRTYGGVSCGFRWMFWFSPLWIIVMCPAADRMAGDNRRRALALLLLGLSVLSAAYPTWNPWVHPWIYDFFASMKWIDV